MPWKPPPSDELLQKAAELRAGGASWPDVAKAVGRKAETVRRWSIYYAVKWARFLTEACENVLSEAAAESMHVLRQQLRSDSETSSRDAAGKIIRYHTAVRTKTGSAPDPGPAQPPRPLAAMLAVYLEGLPDDEFDALCDRVRSHAPLALPVGPNLGTHSPPPPGPP